MPNTPEYLQRTLKRERQELCARIDAAKARFKIEQHKSTADLKAELLSIARTVFAQADIEQGTGSFVLKGHSTRFIETLEQLPRNDPDFEQLTEISLAIERIFVAAFALQYTI